MRRKNTKKIAMQVTNRAINVVLALTAAALLAICGASIASVL